MTPSSTARIVFFLEGRHVPAARYRVLQFLKNLKAEQVPFRICNSWPEKYRLYPAWLKFKPLQALCAAFVTGWLFALRLLQILLFVPRARTVFLQRDLLFRFPSALLEALIVKLARRSGARVVFDIDDAIYLTPAAPAHGTIERKIHTITQLADSTLCGNHHLEGKMRSFGGNADYLPTVLDTSHFTPTSAGKNATLTIGWIGVAGNLPYLAPLESVLNKLQQPFQMVLVTNRGTHTPFTAPTFPLEIREWHPDREAADIQSFDIGIMPLPDTPWALGKCGLKLLQYMATGLPTVASRLGANVSITEDGVTGFLASTPGEWQTALAKLCANAEIRREMGQRARERVVTEYSLQAWYPRWREQLLGPPGFHLR